MQRVYAVYRPDVYYHSDFWYLLPAHLVDGVPELAACVVLTALVIHERRAEREVA
jgi:hypothetical protein